MLIERHQGTAHMGGGAVHRPFAMGGRKMINVTAQKSTKDKDAPST